MCSLFFIHMILSLPHERSGGERGRPFAFESMSFCGSMQWTYFVEVLLNDLSELGTKKTVFISEVCDGGQILTISRLTQTLRRKSRQKSTAGVPSSLPDFSVLTGEFMNSSDAEKDEEFQEMLEAVLVPYASVWTFQC